MDKQTFMDLTGENPEDMFGGDWQNEVNDIMEAGKAEYKLTYGIGGNLWILTEATA